MKLISEHRAFGGIQRFYEHDAAIIGLPMRFSVFLPPSVVDAHTGAVTVAATAEAAAKAPALFYLAGLTCTEETFPTKAAAQQHAARQGLALISPDTSPRGANLPGDSESWDFGVGAGFYLDATAAPWSAHYKMYSYIVEELTALVAAELPVDPTRFGIFGHSMGGHGALVLGLRNPDRFRSISAFAPISAPSQCAWGQKAFSGYLGADRSAWAAYDATALIEQGKRSAGETPILIDQGLADKFLADGQLQPERFEAACRSAGQALTVRRHNGYDHGYYFISSLIADHIDHHAALLKAVI